MRYEFEESNNARLNLLESETNLNHLKPETKEDIQTILEEYIDTFPSRRYIRIHHHSDS